MVCRSKEKLLSALPSSKDKGLSTLHKIVSENANRASNGDYRKIMEEKRGEPWDETHHAWYEATAIRSMQEISGIIQELDRMTEGASDSAKQKREISCAVERAKILRVLPCSSLSCTAVCPLGKKDIPSNVCSGCRVARYCSARCQKKDWKVHKVACKALAAAEKS